MVAIDPKSLPYPPAERVILRGEWFRLEAEVIDGASGQCMDLSPSDSEGVLCFQPRGVGFYSDSGDLHEWPFEKINGYQVKRG